jgi:hypothetical protein
MITLLTMAAVIALPAAAQAEEFSSVDAVDALVKSGVGCRTQSREHPRPDAYITICMDGRIFIIAKPTGSPIKIGKWNERTQTFDPI